MATKVRGTLKLGDNFCTNAIKIRPIKQGTWNLFPLHTYGVVDINHAAVVYFDIRQQWTVYYYRFADTQGWCVERKGLLLRMPEKDFEAFFGKYEILPPDTVE